jgi:enoyl-CoA hydratase/carnithine racemase
LIGANKALEMMLTGETVTPERALELGIVNRIFPAEKIEEETAAYTGKLAEGASRAVGSIKQAVYRGTPMDLKDGLELERDLMEPLFDSEDAKEGLTAFTEKRPPVYKGR